MKCKENQIEDALLLLERAHSEGSESPYAPEKVRRIFMASFSSPYTLILVNKEVSAILVWSLTINYFSSKKMINELVFYSETPGSGFRLLRESEEWLESWGDSISGIHLSTTSRDERIDEMIGRFGYIKVGTQFMKGTG